MMNRMNKFVVGGIFCLSTIFATVMEVSAYTSMYFDSTLDTRNYQLLVSVKYEDSNSELRGEDTYVRENSKHRSSNTPLWRDKFSPKNSDGAYVPKNIGVFDKWYRDPTAFTRTRKVASKKLTVPAMKLHLKGEETYVNYVRSDSRVARVLEDAVVGYERDNGNLSMIDGLNRMLRRIETLKGGYQDDTDFKTVLMALGHLFSGKADGQVIIGVDTAGQSVDEEKDASKEEEKGKESLDPKDEGYEGNGKDIYITMTGKGETVKTITMTQADAPNTILFEEDMLIRADTGYRMSGGPKENPDARTIEITFKGENDKTPRTYVNSNAFNDATIDPDDIAYIKLTNLIAHALIKHEGGISTTSTGEEMGLLEKMVFGVLDVFLDAIEFGLGLVSIEDLVYNAATLDGSNDSRSNYTLGMYPKEWENLISVVYTFVGLISVSVLVFSVLKVFYRMTLDSMNVGKRVELKDDIASILQTIAIMFIFMFIFKFIAQINYIFVTTVYEGLGGGSISLMSMENLGGSMIANLILRAAMVVVKVHINVMYVIRALNLALLIALAPAFITAVAFGKKDLFAKYIQEILGNIFLQSFHALFFLFIFEAQTYLMPTGDITTGFTSIFTSVVLTFTVIPTTKAFKMLVMTSSLMHVGDALGGTFASKVKAKGTKIANKVGGTAVGTVSGHVYSKQQEKASGLSDLQTVAKGSKVYERLNQATSELSDEDKKSEMFKLADSLSDDEKKDLGKYVEYADNLASKGDKELKKMERALKFTEGVNTVEALFKKGSMTKKGQGLAEMNKERKELHDSISQFKDHMQANNFSKTWDLADMKKAPGIYDNSGDIEGSHAITNDFAESLGFNKFNTNFDNSSDIDNGTAFEMITNSCGDIDKVKLPPKEMRKNLPPEVENAYNAVELIQDARKDIRACKTDEDRQKVVERVNERLNDECKVKQEGFVQKDIRNTAQGRMTVHMVGDRKVREGMHKKGITLYAENSQNKGRW